MWLEIAQVLKANGYTDENMVDILDRKMRNMKRSYKTIKENNKKSTTGRGRISWEYYDIFEDFFAEDRTINHGATLESYINIPGDSTSTLSQAESIADKDYIQNRQPLQTLASNISHTYITEESDNTSDIISVSDDINSLLPGSPTVSRTSSKASTHKSTLNTNKNKSKSLYNMRKKQLEIEEQRIEAIKRLKESLDENNKLQKERNDLIKELLLHKEN